ncbi:MAG TPA: ABC-F family ATP-binding cassette domain-containing protein [Bryobacteraceae bacterium]|nr:ABC-F family ATP-binding cassette domain-containing protein [Bryobacteraceae bacterium]
MGILLSVSGIRKSYGARTLFEDLSLSIADGDRTGLIGPNGSGKTTLLEILAGGETVNAGERALRKLTKMAYVPQDSLFGPEETVGSVLRAAMEGLPLLDEEKAARTQMMLGRAGFESLSTEASALSGGWRKRLAIAAALVMSPDLLLLDEPTNHLDLEGILWLEKSIQTVNACLVVTHDRYFLENIATRMVELNPVYPQNTFQVNGNYSEFLERREEVLEAQTKQQQSLATKVRREVEWLRRGPKARTGKSRARIDSAGQLIDELAAVTTRNRTVTTKIDFTATDRKTKRLIEAEAIAKSLGGRTLFENLSLTLSPGIRIGLMGANGSGKTTLLKIVAGELAPDEGTIRRADRLRIVSFAQDRGAHLDPDLTLRRALCPEGDSVIFRGRPIHVAGWAKRFLFREEQMETPIARLSGGERARVMIARLMLAPADVLLLDEPTNDLDIPTLEVLEDSLLDFAGAMIVVSHDRYLLDRVSTIVIGLDRGQGGVFADYSQWEASRSAPAPGKPAVTETQAPLRDAPKRKLSYLEQREWDGMEARILEAEQQLSARQRELQEAALEGKGLAEAYEKVQEAQGLIEDLYARWAELETKIAPV